MDSLNNIPLNNKNYDGKVVTRFPPEPNGYLHIGHAKAMYINFTFAKSNNGICYMRFDDTNPCKEKDEYTNSILEDLTWLGHHPCKVTYTSDYFEKLYELAVELIKKDKAYICELDGEKIKKDRMDRIESPYRNRPIEESLKLFNEMREGKHKEGSITLRLKCDMNSLNPNMRDLIAYRILFKEHHRTGNKWVIYPTYDFSHPLVDSLEGISHSLCSIEFQTRNELYRWLLNTLDMHRSTQIEYSRLNISHTVLSKRKLIELVNNGFVTGWDDPRMPTIKGFRRKGFTPSSINNFCERVGLNLAGSSVNIVDYKLLEECLRQELDKTAPRVMAILDPLKVTIVNSNKEISANASDFPFLGDTSPSHEIKVRNIIYIDREDFRIEDSPKYFRLAPNKIVRLKYLGLIKCIGYSTAIDGSVKEVLVELLPSEYKPEKRVKGTINWVSEIDHCKIEIRKFDHIFPQEIDSSKDWLSQLNINSKKSLNVMTDTSIKNGKPFDKYQFERIGYFSIDPDSSEDKIVMNMTVSLKEDKNKN